MRCTTQPANRYATTGFPFSSHQICWHHGKQHRVSTTKRLPHVTPAAPHHRTNSTANQNQACSQVCHDTFVVWAIMCWLYDVKHKYPTQCYATSDDCCAHHRRTRKNIRSLASCGGPCLVTGRTTPKGRSQNDTSVLLVDEDECLLAPHEDRTQGASSQQMSAQSPFAEANQLLDCHAPATGNRMCLCTYSTVAPGAAV
jgi:hypothetical protein